MALKELLRDVLQEYLADTDTGATRLANLSKVPRKTINHWLSGHVVQPRHWQPLIKVAMALHLNEMQADRLLQSAGHKRIRQLLAYAQGSDRTLLATFNGHVAPSSAAPFLAPMDLTTFVGRTDELNQLRIALLDHGQAAIVGVRGMGGVGKSALAAHAAYQLKACFPDGVLWARLDASDTLTILASFANAYDEDVSQFRDIESRAAAVRNILANKRALVVLDNAETSVQVRPLLPPNTGLCAVLVTTRDDLPATDGWMRISLRAFEAESGEAMQLFKEYFDAAQAQQHAAALNEIATLLGHLPLALAIAAGLLAWRLRGIQSTVQGGLIIQALLADLRREEMRLRRLQRDDLNVIATFNLSYDALSIELQGFFAQLGVFGGQDFSTDAAAHVAGVSVAVARERLKILETRSLVQLASDMRFRLHPLLRDYARERLATTDRLAEEATLRSIIFFTASLQGANDNMKAAEADASNITHLLDADFSPTRAPAMIALSQAFYPFIESRGLFTWAKRVYAQACDAAGRLSDDMALAQSLRALASTVLRLGEFEAVVEISTRGIGVARQIGNDELTIRFLNNIGSAYFGRGHYADSVRVGKESLAIARAINHRHLIAGRLITLGTALAELGDIEQGKQHLIEGKAMAEEVGDLVSTLVALINLSEFELGSGNYESSLALLSEGIILARQHGQRERLANLLINFGNVKSIRGQYNDAELALNEGLQISQELGMPWMMSLAQCTWADHLLRLQKYGPAAQMAMEALSAGERINSDQMMANALFALAKIKAAQGNLAEAESLGRESLTLFAPNQPARENEVRNWLESL